MRPQRRRNVAERLRNAGGFQTTAFKYPLGGGFSGEDLRKRNARTHERFLSLTVMVHDSRNTSYPQWIGWCLPCGGVLFSLCCGIVRCLAI
jgi:hypothetical protein